MSAQTPRRRRSKPSTVLAAGDVGASDGRHLALLEHLKARQFPPLKVRMYDAGKASTVAMDDAEGTGYTSLGLKSAFSLQRLGIPEVLAAWYGSQTFIGYQMCAILAQQWLIQKACAQPARDAVRKGWSLSASNGEELAPEVLKYIEDADRRLKVRRNLVEFVKMCRVFGIRIAMCKVHSDDPDYLVNPFNIDSVTPGSYRGIVQIDPYWITPELTTSESMDPLSLGYFQPTYWIVNGKRVHKSHLIIITGPEVPDVLKPQYLFGGLSVPQQIYERVYAAERCANEAPMLTTSKRSTFLYTDAEKALADESRFLERIEWWTQMRDNHGVKVLDKDGDKAEQFDTSLADLDAIIMTQYQLVAAVANVPATKLLGTTPKGFNSTGEYEESNYHEELEAIQANDMQPLLDRHYACLMRSEVRPKFTELQVGGLACTWHPLDSLTAEEQATVNKTKADTDAVLAGAGAIDGEDIRARLAADSASGYAGIEQGEVQEPIDGDETTSPL